MPLWCACDIIPAKLWEEPGRPHISEGSVTTEMEPDTGKDSHEERDDWNDRNSSLFVPRANHVQCGRVGGKSAVRG